MKDLSLLVEGVTILKGFWWGFFCFLGFVFLFFYTMHPEDDLFLVTVARNVHPSL